MNNILTTIKPINLDENRIDALKRYIDIVSKTQCKNINLNFKHIHWNKTQDLILYSQEIFNYCKNKNIKIPVTHAPYFDEDESFGNNISDNILKQKICDAIESSNILGAKIIVYHATIVFENKVYNEEKTIETNVEFALKIAKTAHNFGIKLAIENNVCSNNSTYGQCVEPSPTLLTKVCKRVNDKMGDNVLGICYDVGHINLTNYDILENLQNCKDYLSTLHIHNNFGYRDRNKNIWKNDLHNPVIDGNINMNLFLNELKKVFNGDIVIESKYRNQDALEKDIEKDYLFLNSILND